MSGMIGMRVRHPPAVLVAYRRTGRGNTRATPPPFRGILQADAFTGYDRLFSQNVKVVTDRSCVLGLCPAKIHDVYISKSATAEEALKRISELYAIEDEIRGYRSQSVLPSRQQKK